MSWKRETFWDNENVTINIFELKTDWNDQVQRQKQQVHNQKIYTVPLLNTNQFTINHKVALP